MVWILKNVANTLIIKTANKLSFVVDSNFVPVFTSMYTLEMYMIQKLSEKILKINN